MGSLSIFYLIYLATARDCWPAWSTTGGSAPRRTTPGSTPRLPLTMSATLTWPSFKWWEWCLFYLAANKLNASIKMNQLLKLQPLSVNILIRMFKWNIYVYIWISPRCLSNIAQVANLSNFVYKDSFWILIIRTKKLLMWFFQFFTVFHGQV